MLALNTHLYTRLDHTIYTPQTYNILLIYYLVKALRFSVLFSPEKIQNFKRFFFTAPRFYLPHIFVKLMTNKCMGIKIRMPSELNQAAKKRLTETEKWNWLAKICSLNRTYKIRNALNWKSKQNEEHKSNDLQTEVKQLPNEKKVE